MFRTNPITRSPYLNNAYKLRNKSQTVRMNSTRKDIKLCLFFNSMTRPVNISSAFQWTKEYIQLLMYSSTNCSWPKETIDWQCLGVHPHPGLPQSQQINDEVFQSDYEKNTLWSEGRTALVPFLLQCSPWGLTEATFQQSPYLSLGFSPCLVQPLSLSLKFSP